MLTQCDPRGTLQRQARTAQQRYQQLSSELEQVKAQLAQERNRRPTIASEVADWIAGGHRLEQRAQELTIQLITARDEHTTAHTALQQALHAAALQAYRVAAQRPDEIREEKKRAVMAADEEGNRWRRLVAMAERGTLELPS